MWQTFPEHTKNLTTNSQESNFKSLNAFATTEPKALCSCHVSVVTILSFMDICLDSKPTKYGTIWHLAALTKQGYRLGRAGRERSETLQSRSCLGLHTLWACRESQASTEGRPWHGVYISHQAQDYRSPEGRGVEEELDIKGRNKQPLFSSSPFGRALHIWMVSVVWSPFRNTPCFSNNILQNSPISKINTASFSLRPQSRCLQLFPNSSWFQTLSFFYTCSLSPT